MIPVEGESLDPSALKGWVFLFLDIDPNKIMFLKTEYIKANYKKKGELFLHS
jgi:hypothetical protein